jgi:hypothetical protein
VLLAVVFDPGIGYRLTVPPQVARACYELGACSSVKFEYGSDADGTEAVPE